MSGERPPDSERGEFKLGIVLWLLHQLPGFVVGWLTDLGMPKTSITPSMWDNWLKIIEKSGVVSIEGDIVALSKYANLDGEWVGSLIHYIEIIFNGKNTFNSTPARIKITDSDSITIALIGDWGTGIWPDGDQHKCPAILVRDKVKALHPDYTIHLGDVYYSGTEDEEENYFVKHWVSGSRGTLALNSNHEMYSGARGYFQKALKNPLFQIQQNTSYFSIEFENWIILGLDSAYYDTSPLYQEGALIDENQRGFIKNMNS